MVEAHKTLLRVAPADASAPSADLPPSHTNSVWEEMPAGDAGTPVGTGRILSGRYRLERKLGEGGMGSVFYAVDQEVVGESFAVKVLRPEIREYPESLALLREEVRKTRSLQHPNIVGVYSLNADRGDVYMLMEYLEGKTLGSLIDDDFGRGMPFDRAWPLIQDICTALGYAHDHSVIHSDLKPANVFVTTGGKAKLLDFGIARATRGNKSRIDPGALGALTPAYASCEMIEGLAPDVRDDIYALGCLIYELLSGRHPFEGRAATEARAAHLTPPPLTSLSRTQNAALAHALAFDRGSRTRSVEELLSALRAPTIKQRRGLLIAVGVAAALLGIGWALWKGPLAPGSNDDPLTRARELADKARALGVVKTDRSLQEGTQMLALGEQELTAGNKTEGMRLLRQAQTALAAADEKGQRFARLGSNPHEVDLALNLCTKFSKPCEAADFDGEPPRMAVLSPFELDRAGVTNREFAAFVAATGHKTPKNSWMSLRDSNPPSAADSAGYPVRGIDFDSATAYCAWVKARLPSEDEWEFVARGVDGKLFPWGNQPQADDGAERRLLPVDEQPVTGRFGNRGLGGALWEWVTANSGAAVLRGPSWMQSNPVAQRLAIRRLEDPSHELPDTGFRCARPKAAWPKD